MKRQHSVSILTSVTVQSKPFVIFIISKLLQGILESSKTINQENFFDKGIQLQAISIHNYFKRNKTIGSCIENMAAKNKIDNELFQN